MICTEINARIGCPPGQFGKMQEKWVKNRGVAQRNMGISELRKLNPVGILMYTPSSRALTDLSQTDGVVYFADDDNTYDWRLFAELRKTQRVCHAAPAVS